MKYFIGYAFQPTKLHLYQTFALKCCYNLCFHVAELQRFDADLTLKCVTNKVLGLVHAIDFSIGKIQCVDPQQKSEAIPRDFCRLTLYVADFAMVIQWG